MKNKKTVIYISTNTKKDGAEKSLVSLQRYLISERNLNTLTIIPRHGPIEDLLKEAGISYWIYRFEGNVNYNRGTKPLRGCVKMMINYHTAKVLSKRIKEQKINAIGVHSNTITSEMGAYLASDLKVPHIWHVREFGKLDFGFDFELGFSYIKQLAKKASKVVCNSKAVADYYSEYFDKENLTYIFNGVNCISSGTNKWDTKMFKILLIGRLSKEKGQDIAIEACKILFDKGYKDFCLDLYGEGVDKEKYERLIKDYSLEGIVNLKGYSNKIPIHEYQVGLMCSNHEAFGRVTIEYMANGLPVVGLDSGGTSEIIENNVTGYLLKNSDAKVLSNYLVRLYSDRTLCKKLGENGKHRAETFFTEKIYCDNIYNLYRECFDLGGV